MALDFGSHPHDLHTAKKSWCVVCGEKKKLTAYGVPLVEYFRGPDSPLSYPASAGITIGICNSCTHANGFPVCTNKEGQVIVWYRDHYRRPKQVNISISPTLPADDIRRLPLPKMFEEDRKWPQNHGEWIKEVDWVSVYRSFLPAPCEPREREHYVISGWRTWAFGYNLTTGEVSIRSPIITRPATLVAQQCISRDHCRNPDCTPPCASCACGIYINYKAPSQDDVRSSATAKALWFFCEAKGKTIKGSLGARAQELDPIFCLLPEEAWNSDIRHAVRQQIRKVFGEQIQIINPDDVPTLREGGATLIEVNEEGGLDESN